MKFVKLIIYFSILIAQDPPWEDLVTPTPTSGVFQGQALVNGSPASAGDWVAAFDEDGNCAGASELTLDGGTAYINLPIYGDDGTTPDIDEGMNGGEDFNLRLWDSSADMIYGSSESFDCWYNNIGAPMDDCGDYSTEYDFVDVIMSLNEPWIPYKVLLNQNYPNPFNMETTISFNIDIAGIISLEIHDFTGRKVRDLVQKYFDSGEYTIVWYGENNQGYILPSGVYFYRLSHSQDDRIKYFTKKMVLIK